MYLYGYKQYFVIELDNKSLCVYKVCFIIHIRRKFTKELELDQWYFYPLRCYRNPIGVVEGVLGGRDRKPVEKQVN